MTRILVVEKEQAVGTALVRHGAVVDTTPDAGRAVTLASSGDYRVAVLNLPVLGRDGLDLLGAMVAAHTRLQVIVLAGMSDAQTKVSFLDLGAADYLTKPVSLPELLARIRRLAGPDEDRDLRAGPVTLDLERRAVHVGGEPIPLTGREFRLLRHLMLQHDEACSRMELLAEVWGYSFDPGTNVVDVCIRRLRAKIGADRIETIRSVGYAFQSCLEDVPQEAASG